MDLFGEETEEEKKAKEEMKAKNKKEKKDNNNEINLSQALLENDSNEEEEEDYKQKYLDMKDEMEMYKNIVNPLTEEKDKLETEIKELKETIKEWVEKEKKKKKVKPERIA